MPGVTISVTQLYNKGQQRARPAVMRACISVSNKGWVNKHTATNTPLVPSAGRRPCGTTTYPYLRVSKAACNVHPTLLMVHMLDGASLVGPGHNAALTAS